MTFDPDKDIPDLQGKVILVTGGNVGLGFESIHQLSKHNPTQIFLGARSRERAEEAISKLKSLVPNGAPVTFLQMDLTSFDSIKKSVAEFQSNSDRLDILMLNAGIMATPPGLTKEGYEIQFGTNHVGHALLTKLLLPTLKKTAAQPGSDVRIITLSSAAERWAPKSYMLSEAKTDMAGTSTWTRYGQSKLANIHFSRTLALLNPEIKCISLHPGAVSTNLISGPGATYGKFANWFMHTFSGSLLTPVKKGAWGQLWAATSPDAESGAFYHPVGVKGKDTAAAKNEERRKELWEWTEKELDGHWAEVP